MVGPRKGSSKPDHYAFVLALHIFLPPSQALPPTQPGHADCLAGSWLKSISILTVSSSILGPLYSALGLPRVPVPLLSFPGSTPSFLRVQMSSAYTAG